MDIDDDNDGIPGKDNTCELISLLPMLYVIDVDDPDDDGDGIVDLLASEHRNLAVVGDDHLNGETDTCQFTARSNAGQRFTRLTGIRCDGEFDLIGYLPMPSMLIGCGVAEWRLTA